MLRLTTWNCCRGKPEVKLPRLLDLEPDIVVLQECARPSDLTHGQHAWHGDNPRQGLLAFAHDGYQVSPIARRRIAARLYFPVRISGAAEFNLLVVWVKPYKRPGGYMDSLLRGIAAYRDFILSGPTVVVGDFNSAAYFGPAHCKMVTLLRERYGLVSAYHECYGLDHGSETQFTYFDRTQHGRPYHLDYCFVPQAWLPRLRNVVVGDPRDWRRFGDHVPLTVEIQI